LLPDDERKQVIENIRFVQHTPHTIVSADELCRDLAVVRRNGYSLDCEEYVVGCYCVGAPVLDAFGYPAAAIWVAGNIDRLLPGGYEALGSRVMYYAASISNRLIQPTA